MNRYPLRMTKIFVKLCLTPIFPFRKVEAEFALSTLAMTASAFRTGSSQNVPDADNPETRVATERARRCAEALGLARSVFPRLPSGPLSRAGRQESHLKEERAAYSFVLKKDAYQNPLSLYGMQQTVPRGRNEVCTRIREGLKAPSCSAICLALMSNGCSRAPAIDVMGSLFPAWLLCIALGILLAVLTRWLLLHYGIRLLFSFFAYPCLATTFTFAIWLVFF